MNQPLETYLIKIVDLLFEIRNNQERTNELLEDLKNPVEPEKREMPMTRKEQRMMRNQQVEAKGLDVLHSNDILYAFSKNVTTALLALEDEKLNKIINEPNGETGTQG